MATKNKSNDDLELHTTPVQHQADKTSVRHRLSHDEITHRTYEIYLERGGLQVVSLMIGSGPNANSKKSLFSHEAGIVFSSGVAPTPKAESDIRRMGTMEKAIVRDWPP